MVRYAAILVYFFSSSSLLSIVSNIILENMFFLRRKKSFVSNIKRHWRRTKEISQFFSVRKVYKKWSQKRILFFLNSKDSNTEIYYRLFLNKITEIKKKDEKLWISWDKIIWFFKISLLKLVVDAVTKNRTEILQLVRVYACHLSIVYKQKQNCSIHYFIHFILANFCSFSLLFTCISARHKPVHNCHRPNIILSWIALSLSLSIDCMHKYA